MTFHKITGERYIGLRQTAPCKTKSVHAFDFDDCLTMKPAGFDNTGLSKDDFFDAARTFPPNQLLVQLTKLLAAAGDRIVIATARPPGRLKETISWLQSHGVPFDSIMHSRGKEPSGVVKQEMLMRLQDDYKDVVALYDDSRYNIEGAERQGVHGVHIKTNESYWDANPETLYTVQR